MTSLTYDKTQDYIRSVTAGVVGVRPIDWQNRPTFQQAVAFTDRVPRPGVAAGGSRQPSVSARATGALGMLPRTGGTPWLPAAALLLLVGGAALARLRRAAATP